jgi:hypothetical protein
MRCVRGPGTEHYRGFVKGVPLKSHLRTQAKMIEALEDAIGKYQAHSEVLSTADMTAIDEAE